MKLIQWVFGIAIGLYMRLGRPKLLQWGTTLEETKLLFKGDTLISYANLQATRTITINAPCRQVWGWLAQMGRERVGFYGIDTLNNWNIPSITYLRNDLAPLELGMILDNGLQVLDFSPNEYLLLGGFDMPNDCGGRTDLTYLYWLLPCPNEQTRLIIRMRGFSDGGLKGWVFNRLFEIFDSWMTIAQLKGIKQRAERMIHPPLSIPIPFEKIDFPELDLVDTHL